VLIATQGRRLLFAGVLLTVALHAADDDLEAMEVFNFDVSLRRNLNLQLHARFRLNNNLHDFFQARGGAIIAWTAWPRVQLIGGYYLLNQRLPNEDRVNYNRFFGGTQIRFFQHRRTTLDSHSFVERFTGLPSPDYSRFRQRVTWTLPRPGLSPYASLEALYALHMWTGRYAGGISFPIGDRARLLLGYQARQYAPGRYGHIIQTGLQYQLRKPPEP